MRKFITVLFFTISCISAAEKPNVILIMADDMGFGNVSSFGATRMKTPHIDSLVESGVKLTDFHTNSSICSPTRASFLTGLYQQRVGDGVDFGSVSSEGLRSIQEKGEQVTLGMTPDEFTIADAFKKAGYYTGIYGKWHIGYAESNNPINNGFDEFKGYLSGNVDLFNKIDQSGRHDWFHGTKPHKDDTYLTELITTDAINRIDLCKKEEKPFMLFLAHIAPHYPLQGPEDKAWRELGKKRNTRFELSKTAAQDNEREKAMVEAMDQQIGRLIIHLKENGLYENTIILFCADNGPSQRFTSTAFKKALNTESSAGMYRGSKSTFYEGGIRVPAVISWPARIPAGRESDETLMTMDVMPTLLALTGNGSVTPEGHHYDGADVSANLLEGKPIADRTLFWGSKNIPRLKYRGVREKDWMLVDLSLFNLADDPRQQVDLAKKEPEIYMKLDQKWKSWVKETIESKQHQKTYFGLEAQFKKIGRSHDKNPYSKFSKKTNK